MPKYIPMLKTASRVLLALAEHQKPADEDVAELRRFGPEFEHQDIGVLASYLVQVAIKKRRKIRAAAADD